MTEEVVVEAHKTVRERKAERRKTARGKGIVKKVSHRARKTRVNGVVVKKAKKGRRG